MIDPGAPTIEHVSLATAPEEAARPARPWYRRPGGLGAAAVVAGSFALWAYAFSGVAAKTAPDTLKDKAFPALAEAACALAQQDIAALPNARTAKTATERAVTLDQATDRADALVRELRLSIPADEADADILIRWLADWDRYLTSRREFADALRVDSRARFVIDTRSSGEGITKAMDNLATVNRMPSCKTPGDVG